ncbi:hypothetical protein JTE90_019649 [Oedothorax gibbosus]|uniref:Uncharacterized protein n=1 Tax=Oedothorax gibbosus TaxID=931172 RepID=A0AAV6TZQ3_9ARAC|nr:hypothetical protein JTE90_019649 [Oedothorax gibbosus]
MGMRNVLVGEFIAPILDQFKPPGRSGSMGKVDNMVEVRKKEIEIGKLRATVSAIQSKVTVLEEELAKEREAIRKYLEIGVALSKTVEEIEKVSDNKVANIKKTYESQLTALDLLEKERNNSCNKFLEKLVKGRADEISSTDKILAHYDVNFREQNEKIVSISSEMGEIKEAIKNSLDNLKIDLTNHSMPSSSASPTYADIIGRENNNTTTMFVDLPTDGEGGKDFKGFKNKLESLLTNENVKCNDIFETKKGAKISAPSLTDAHKMRDYLNKNETLLNLKVSIQSVSVVEENTSVKVVADTQVSSPSSSVLEDNTSVSDALDALNFDMCSVGSTIQASPSSQGDEHFLMEEDEGVS